MGYHMTYYYMGYYVINMLYPLIPTCMYHSYPHVNGISISSFLHVTILVMLRVKVSLVDTVVNICQDGSDTNNTELGVHINR